MKGYELFIVSLILAVYWLQLSSDNYEIGRVGDELFSYLPLSSAFAVCFSDPFMCSFSMSLTTTKKPPFLAFSNTATTTTTGGAQDKTVYPSSEETFGTVKIMEDSLPMVSERNPDELSALGTLLPSGKGLCCSAINECQRVTLREFGLKRWNGVWRKKQELHVTYL